MVAYTEIVILIRVILGAAIFRNSFTTPIVFAHFLRQRYYHSSFTRDAIAHTREVVDGQAVHAPPVVGRIWISIKSLISRWTGATLVPQNSPAGGQPPTAARHG